MRPFILGAIAISVGACAVQRGLTPDAIASLKNRQLTTIVRRAPPLLADPPSKYKLGRTGVLAMALAGQRLVRENAIADPALKIAQELGDRLRQDYGLRPSAPVLVGDNDQTKPSQVNSPTNLVLDVWTDNWALEPFPSEDPMYRVRYLVNIRLSDVKQVRPIDGTSGVVVIAEGTCSSVSEDESLAPSYDKMMADHAHRLKDELDSAAEFCVEDFRARILSLAPAP